MTDLAVRRLAVRGPEAACRRLARVAAGPLPSALERVLGPWSGSVARLVVPLDLDLSAYDDETLAVLWADRIRAALEPHVAADPIAAWLDSLLALGPGELARVAAEVRGRPDVLARLRAMLGHEEQRQVVAALLRAAAAGPARPPGFTPAAGRAAGSNPTPTARDAAPGAATAEPIDALPVPEPGDVDRSGWEAAWSAAARSATPRAPGRRAHPVTAAAQRLAGRSETTGPRPAAVPGAAFRSRVGGLVLLYPWLKAYLDQAALDRPDLAPEDARRLAAAALADPDDPLVQHDPLVRLLAGAAPDAATADLPPLPAHDGVLRQFAALLRGFEESSPAYLRAHFVHRGAVLTPLPEFVLADVEPGPLDLLLGALPYPLGMFGLPWTPAFVVRIGR